MDTVLKPERLESDPSSSKAAKEWLHWKRTFQNFIAVLPAKDLNKLSVLANFLSPEIFQHIEECANYEDAITELEGLFVKPHNEIFARHLLATRRQQSNETLDDFLQALSTLSKDCNFKSVTAALYKEESIRDAFITGIQSHTIRQRLLENKSLDLKEMFDKARALESAMRSSESYNHSSSYINAVPHSEPSNIKNVPRSESTPSQEEPTTLASADRDSSLCFFCGYRKHPRARCPAREVTCDNCQKKGHYAKVCRGKPVTKDKVSASMWNPRPTLASVHSCPALSKSSAIVEINGVQANALFDSGSSESFIHPSLADKANLSIQPASGTIALASSVASAKVSGTCRTDLFHKDRTYKDVRLSVLHGLCADIILGLDFQSKHESVTFQFGGSEPPLSICSFSTLNVEPPELFANLTDDCRPIAMKSRQYSKDDSAFIDSEVSRLLKEGIIEPSNSPWRAQVVVTKDENHKKRLVLDYSQTINRFTILDAFPLPRINDMINDIAQYRVFSTIDLRSAYHQVPLKTEDKPFTAFEARNNLYQFTRLPFGVTNGVACFQREMMRFVEEFGLKGVFPYLDDITICGKDQEEHDANLERFIEAAKQKNICYNDDKSVFSTRRLPILGYLVEDGQISPDPDRLKPLRDLPVPKNTKSLNRCLGLFSYYSKWIPKYSDRVKPLSSCKSFPLPSEAVEAFHYLKQMVEESSVMAIDEAVPFEVQTDASDIALAATLNQQGRPVAFWSRALQGSELKHASVEKEAQAIIEAIRHWRHLLTGRHFTLKTDQKSVSYMFDQKHKGKIKNDKIMRWRLELSCYSFDISYLPGKENIPADTLSRVACSISSENSLYKLHESLCHPGITRLHHFIRVKNLPYSLEEIKSMTSKCSVCCECKPRYHHPTKTPLIKATQPFERINIDFKGPLPTNNANKYFLNIIDEYSRFPFVYPCPDVSSVTVIKCLTSLFSLVGMPAYVHSDRGSSFMSKEVRDFLGQKGVATSRTTSYNPEGNGQVERYNGAIWKGITMCLKSKNMPLKYWQESLPDVLHSARSLLCTATNETPHERFFGFTRRSSSGPSIPAWLSTPGPVLVKRHVRSSKTDPLVEECELLEANSHYAHVRYSDGRETTVATKHLAPRGLPEVTELPLVHNPGATPSPQPPQATDPEVTEENTSVEMNLETSSDITEAKPPLRRSERVRRPVDRLGV